MRICLPDNFQIDLDHEDNKGHLHLGYKLQLLFHPPGLLTLILLLFLPFRSENRAAFNAINSRHRQLRGLSEVQAPSFSLFGSKNLMGGTRVELTESALLVCQYPINIY